MRSKRNLRYSLIAALASVAVSACGGAGTIADPSSNGPPPFGGLISHVVIIVQENRSVDDLFNGFPGADTVTTGITHTGRVVPLRPRSLSDPADPSHAHTQWQIDYAGGDMNGFDRNDLPDHLFPYSYVPRSETEPLRTLASQYVFGDRMFESNTGPSFPAHQYLIAGQSGLSDENPNRHPWGCDASAATTVATIRSNGDEGPRVYPCFDYPTLADELDSAGASWRYYAPHILAGGGVWSAYQAIHHIRFGADWPAKVISPETRFLDDIADGHLANVTWITPRFFNSDHPGNRSVTGPDWVATLVNAIGTSQFWNSTAVIITWDDWGGFYEHVKPPHLDVMGLGFRVPLIIVSPYAKTRYVSHRQHEFGSIVRFIEEQFRLPSLAQTDARADDLSDCFNFAQSPRRFQRVRTRLGTSFFLAQPIGQEAPDDY